VAERISHTTHGDAPLSAAKNPDLSAIGVDTPDAHELIGRTVTINRPRSEFYSFWRTLENLPKFMENIVSITKLDAQRSHWVFSAPGGKTVEWDSVIVEDIPNQLIRWKSVEGSDITHSGHIEFRDAHGKRGTEVTATILYDPPAGPLGKIVAKLFQEEPKIQSRRDLRRLKQLLETGEIATSIRNVAQAGKKTAGASISQSH
jgi:uncharacterized membrane protein